jgi:hypothetical protein
VFHLMHEYRITLQCITNKRQCLQMQCKNKCKTFIKDLI